MGLIKFNGFCSILQKIAVFVLTVLFLAAPSLQSQVFGDLTVGTQTFEEHPTLPELYDQLSAYFDVGAIEDFISWKNQSDPEAAQLFLDIDQYLRDPEAQSIVRAFWSDPEFNDAIYYLYSNGLPDIYNKINEFHRRYGYDLVVPPVAANRKFVLEPSDDFNGVNLGGTLNITKKAPKLFQEFLDFLNLERVRLFFHKMYETPALQDLYARFADSSFGEHYREFKKLPELERLGDSLVGAGFEIDTLKKIVEVLMTWENHTSVGLRHDLDSSRRGVEEFTL